MAIRQMQFISSYLTCSGVFVGGVCALFVGHTSFIVQASGGLYARRDLIGTIPATR
jgi:hypothetical protein